MILAEAEEFPLPTLGQQLGLGQGNLALGGVGVLLLLGAPVLFDDGLDAVLGGHRGQRLD